MIQVRLRPGGKWHQPAVTEGPPMTKCEEPIRGVYFTRDHELDLDLCEICFNPSDRDTGEMMELEREAKEYDPSLFYDDDEDPTDPYAEPFET
jgi:hypothetical protein